SAPSSQPGFRRKTLTHIDPVFGGQSIDNIFVERLWRSLKYECLYLHAWETGSEARAGIAKWTEFYNHKRPHCAHGGKPPAVVYWLEKEAMQPDQQVK
ncbi:MAG: transposase, partial [Pseudomonadota bacterium]